MSSSENKEDMASGALTVKPDDNAAEASDTKSKQSIKDEKSFELHSPPGTPPRPRRRQIPSFYTDTKDLDIPYVSMKDDTVTIERTPDRYGVSLDCYPSDDAFKSTLEAIHEEYGWKGKGKEGGK